MIIDVVFQRIVYYCTRYNLYTTVCETRLFTGFRVVSTLY